MDKQFSHSDKALPTNIEINTAAYEAKNGHPRGHGRWEFEISTKQGKRIKLLESVQDTGPYSDVLRRVASRAKKLGGTTIYLHPVKSVKTVKPAPEMKAPVKAKKGNNSC